MKHTMKKLLSLILVIIIMLLSVVPMTDLGIEASAASYNASAALAYAAAHWNDGVGLCAEFVSNCLNAGGLKAWSNGCTRLMNQLESNGEGIRIKLNTSGNYISAYNNEGNFSLGDPVFWKCDNCGDYMHAGLISGVDSSGYITHYAHNSAQNNTRIWVGSCYQCGRAYSGMYVRHFSEHTHSYSSHYEGDHPHRAYKKCSCNDWYYTGENVILDTCKYCNWPEKPSFSSWKNAYLETDTITFTWNATKNTSHYNIWLYIKNAQGVWTKYEHITYVNSGVTKKLPANEYRCELQSCNSEFFDGDTWLYEESDFYYFTVFEELEKPEFSSWKETYSESETIQFKWDTQNNATHYNIWLYTKNAQGEWVKYEHMTYVNSGVTKKLPANEYRCILQIYNSNFNKGSDWLYEESDFYYFSVLPNHTHSYTSKVTKNATCTAIGVKTFTCSCGASYTEAIAKTAHNSNTKIPAVAATCTKTGLTEGKKCSVCGTVTVVQQIIPAKGHTEVIDKAVSATCTKSGLTEGKHCSVCSIVIVAQNTVNATGHKDNNFDGKCDNCGLSSATPDTPTTPNEPAKDCSCNCHAGGIKAFFFKIINFFQKLFGMNKICACGVKH